MSTTKFSALALAIALAAAAAATAQDKAPNMNVLNVIQPNLRLNTIGYTEQDIDPYGVETSFKGTEEGVSIGGALNFFQLRGKDVVAQTLIAKPAEKGAKSKSFDQPAGFYWGAQANFTNVKTKSDNYTWERKENTADFTDNFFLNTEGNFGIFIPINPWSKLLAYTGLGFRLWTRKFELASTKRYSENAYLFYTPYYVDYRVVVNPSTEVGAYGCVRIQFAGSDVINLAEWDRSKHNYLNPELVMKPDLGFQFGALFKYLFSAERNPNDFFHVDGLVFNIFWEQWSCGKSNSVQLFDRRKKSDETKPATDTDISTNNYVLRPVIETDQASWDERWPTDDPRGDLASNAIWVDRWKNVSNQFGIFVGIQLSF